MIKNIQKAGVLIILSIILFSCASKAAPYYETADSSYEMGGFVAEEAPTGSSAVRRERPLGAESDARMIAYSASLSLTVKDTEETKKTLVDQVKSSRGFIVRESESQITARIPAENMDAFLSSAKTLGKIESESKTGTDITDQYRDNVIRLENLKSLRARYLALLEKADSVNDMLNIEKELGRINSDIDVMEGRIRHAEQSVTYSSITVRFREKAKPGPAGWIFYGLYRGVKWLFVWD